MKVQTDDSALVWTEKSRKQLLETAVMTVTETDSTASDGQEGRYIVMDAKDWVIVVPVAGTKFLMVKQWRHGEKALSIEFPGGVIETGEEPEKAAARELREETGYTAKHMIHLGTMNPNPALMSNHVHIFIAEGLEKTSAQQLDSDEYVHYMEKEQKEVLDKIGTKEYPHALMAAAAALYMRYKIKQK
ncbi:MAG TPA: NUDIX hydrolase [Treponema sp.]|nr:NUDIX hydrolase [Treponema sp.]